MPEEMFSARPLPLPHFLPSHTDSLISPQALSLSFSSLLQKSVPFSFLPHSKRPPNPNFLSPGSLSLSPLAHCFRNRFPSVFSPTAKDPPNFSPQALSLSFSTQPDRQLKCFHLFKAMKLHSVILAFFNRDLASICREEPISCTELLVFLHSLYIMCVCSLLPPPSPLPSPPPPLLASDVW